MNQQAARTMMRGIRPGNLPPDGFAWRLWLVLLIHSAGLFYVIRGFEKHPEIVLSSGSGGAAGGLSAEELPAVNWVDSSLAAPVPPAKTIAQATAPQKTAVEDPASDIPLPQPVAPPAPMPEVKPPPEPKMEPAPVPVAKPEPVRPPEPAPAPPKEPALRPVPKPEAPKPVVAKPEPQLKPVPKPEPRLKPVPVPVPPKPKDVVLKPVPKVELPKEPSLKPVPVAKPTPIVATPPVRAALVSQPIASPSAPGPSNPAMNTAGTGIGSGSGTGSGIPGGTGAGGGSGGTDAISGFHQNVKDSYFSQWQQPRGLTLSGAKYRVRTEIVIDRAGRISSARIVTTSGNAEMDQSVREAVGRVNKVAPLPKGIDGETYALILNFDI